MLDYVYDTPLCLQFDFYTYVFLGIYASSTAFMLECGFSTIHCMDDVSKTS